LRSAPCESAKTRGITWLSGVTIAIIGAIMGAIAKHYWGN